MTAQEAKDLALDILAHGDLREVMSSIRDAASRGRFSTWISGSLLEDEEHRRLLIDHFGYQIAAVRPPSSMFPHDPPEYRISWGGV